MDTVYLNGDFLPESEARISPRDRGFRFGDGVFETIPFYGAKPYQWDFHLKRLDQGLEALRIPAPEADWRSIADTLITMNAMQNGFIRIAISRGEGSKGYRPANDGKPTVFIECLPRNALSSTSATLWLAQQRKAPVAALPPHKIAAHGVSSTLALLEAEAHGCDEALMLSENGHLCEAASGNLFWITSGGELLTPSLETGCLEGATRSALMRLHGAREVLAPPNILQGAEAVFLTNCNWGIWPVRELSPQGWQWQDSHPLITQLQKAYEADIHASV